MRILKRLKLPEKVSRKYDSYGFNLGDVVRIAGTVAGQQLGEPYVGKVGVVRSKYMGWHNDLGYVPEYRLEGIPYGWYELELVLVWRSNENNQTS